MASVDYKILNNEKKVIFSHSGKFEQKKFYIYDWINYLIESGVGELILTCINREGTWDGFDLVFLKKYQNCKNTDYSSWWCRLFKRYKKYF